MICNCKHEDGCETNEEIERYKTFIRDIYKDLNSKYRRLKEASDKLEFKSASIGDEISIKVAMKIIKELKYGIEMGFKPLTNETII